MERKGKMNTIETENNIELCNKIVWLENGKIKQIGGKEVAEKYEH